MNELTLKDELTEFLLYMTPSNDIKVEIFMHNESVWLPQKRIQLVPFWNKLQKTFMPQYKRV